MVEILATNREMMDDYFSLQIDTIGRNMLISSRGYPAKINRVGHQ